VPPWCVWLGHYVDGRILLVGARPHDSADPDAVEDAALSATLQLVNLRLYEVPDDERSRYSGALVRWAEAEARRCPEWPVGQCLVDGVWYPTRRLDFDSWFVSMVNLPREIILLVGTKQGTEIPSLAVVTAPSAYGLPPSLLLTSAHLVPPSAMTTWLNGLEVRPVPRELQDLGEA
jgi:hypothetical protein